MKSNWIEISNTEKIRENQREKLKPIPGTLETSSSISLNNTQKQFAEEEEFSKLKRENEDQNVAVLWYYEWALLGPIRLKIETRVWSKL